MLASLEKRARFYVNTGTYDNPVWHELENMLNVNVEYSGHMGNDGVEIIQRIFVSFFNKKYNNDFVKFMDDVKKGKIVDFVVSDGKLETDGTLYLRVKHNGRLVFGDEDEDVTVCFLFKVYSKKDEFFYDWEKVTKD